MEYVEYTEDDIKSVLALSLPRARKRAGLSQQEIADKMGMSRVAISMMETGRQNTTLINFVRMCQILDTHPNELLLELFPPNYEIQHHELRVANLKVERDNIEREIRDIERVIMIRKMANRTP